ncbi:sugar ABC transporter substrate-binding protein [Priestia megaterium]|jgi:multiple sugar transport system substrate-binding protein|uniref:Sugar ABC transporter substrate-binding protein n=1 Tax=Priestia megaterium TaxID=1404 RepID=A0A6H1NVW9_PRIMG|nr:sugar ABC transporter substrate-binding protein [Priestia megaterium]QIZ05408.1 sugar ABC transporter substrate-binding protein [Priestia megaterium]
MLHLKKGFLFFVSLMVLLGLIAGCSSSKDASSEEKDGKVTLRLVESITSPSRTKLLKEMLAKFEDENPTIKVELISPPLKSADEKITQMLVAKEDVDVLEVREQTVKNFSNNKFIEDLSPYTSKWENWDTLTETIKHGATAVDNKPYYIPYGVYEKTLFYRKDWFEAAGLEVPKTWDDLVKAAIKLTDPSKNRYGYSFRGGAGSPDYIEFMTWSYLGKQIAPKDSYFTQDGKVMFDTPEAKQVLDTLVKLYKQASPPDSISWSYPEMVQGFTSGMTAMLIQDPEVIVTADEKMKKGTWATAPIPKGTPSGVAQQPAGTAGWGIGAFSKHKDEAWKLVSFLSSPEQNLYFAKENSLIPIHLSAGEDPYFKEGYFNSYIEMNAKPEEFLIADRPVEYKGYAEYRALAEKDIQALLLGKLSKEDALSKWTDFWKKEKENKK